MSGWWAGLSARERRLVAGAGLLLALFCFWLLAWRPLVGAGSRAEQRAELAREELAWMQVAAGRVERLRAEATGPVGGRGQLSLLALAEQSARAAGLGAGFRRAQPVGEDRLRVSFEAVSFDALLGWLGELEARYGITAEELAADRGAAAGLVDARLLLSE